MTISADDSGHRPTERVISILEAVAASEHGLTLTEISAAIAAAKSTILPVIRTLQQKGYLSLDRRLGKYTSGLGGYALFVGFVDKNPVYRFALQQMRQIVDNCSEICQLGVLDGSDVLYIAKVDSPEPIRLISHVGKKLPANCTALGKALLSSLSFEDLVALYPSGLPSLTENSITDFSALHTQLLSMNERQIMTESGESTPFIKCYAIPLRKKNRAHAAISVSLPNFRDSEEKRMRIEALLLAARQRIEIYMEETGESFVSDNE